MKNNLVLFIVILVAVKSFSQDHAFLNTNQSLINLNPSFAGSNGFIRNQSSFKSNMGSPSTGYTALNSFDAYIKPIKAGIAVSALTNNFANGVLINNKLSFSYAQYFSLLKGKIKLIPSLKLTYAERLMSLEKTWAPSASVNPPSAKINYLDLSTGFLATYKDRLYAGFSISHLNRPDHDVFPYGYSFTYHISYNLKLSEILQMQILGQVQSQAAYASSYVVVNALLYKQIIAGLGLKSSQTPVFNLGYRNNYFILLAGYNVQGNSTSEYSKRSFEVHASFNLRKKELRQTINSFETW